MDDDFRHSLRRATRQQDVVWPLRLLHIPSMSSMERKDYLAMGPPQYAILTYTWGRFRAPAGCPALTVAGTTWKIPPVQEEVISVDAFERVIQHIGSQHEWLWLDIACIDQENESVKMREVARQVNIFHGASEAFAWLHSLDADESAKYVSFLERVATYDALGEEHVWTCASEALRVEQSLGYYQTHLDAIEEALRLLFTDPWFTSLWALQESNLRPNAVLLSTNGEPILYPQEKGAEKKPCRVSLLNSWCEAIWRDLNHYISRKILTPEDHDKAAQIMALIESVGFNFPSSVNPNVQCSAARFRETSSLLDRIYGITSIYYSVLPETFQLPSPSQLPDTDEVAKLERLEFIFASALNTASPWLGQCFIHLERHRPGQSWMITQNIHVPIYLQDFDTKGRVRVEGRVVTSAAGHATASGMACPLKALWIYWEKMLENHHAAFQGARRPYRFAVAYDHDLSEIMAIHASGPILEGIDRALQDPESKFRVTLSLLKKYSPENLYVLALGSTREGKVRVDFLKTRLKAVLMNQILHGGCNGRCAPFGTAIGNFWGLFFCAMVRGPGGELEYVRGLICQTQGMT
ncbi:hypothetical protein BCR34DRAFT_663934 [Clohesyomyces aquaticus]|uniref:Heterokaryon incompatibility domain-containing protein n=1 Tax=Clohesyomyces aquaticus TaxID=1231657 RepID=A0A1Y1ZQZ7_9PLEO|nr:hypothetical protein BCR34DRAFT_663934 [Clohesyomyces aquaticus]